MTQQDDRTLKDWGISTSSKLQFQNTKQKGSKGIVLLSLGDSGKEILSLATVENKLRLEII